MSEATAEIQTPPTPPLTETPVPPKRYDADLWQDIPVTLALGKTEEGQVVKRDVLFTLGPQTDADLDKYDELLESYISEDGAETVIEDDSAKAAMWLFDRVSIAVRWEGHPAEAAPDNWREKRLVVGAKVSVIEDRYLAAEEVPHVVSSDDFDLGGDPDANLVTLKAWLAGAQIVVSHRFVNEAADFYREFKKIQGAGGFNQKRKAIRVPGKMRLLAALYDRMTPQATGYVGRVPKHHKALAVSVYFNRLAGAVGK